MSDRATECPHCGCPREYQNGVPTIDNTHPHTKETLSKGNSPKHKNSRKNPWIILSAVSLTIIVAIAFIYYIDNRAKQKEYLALVEQQKQDSIRVANEKAERLQREHERQERIEVERLQRQREEQERLAAAIATRGPEWLRGVFCHERIDQIYYEVVYEVFYFENDGTYRYGESRSSRYFKPSNRPFKYTVQGNVIYTEDGQPLLTIDESSHSLSRCENSSHIFQKL